MTNESFSITFTMGNLISTLAKPATDGFSKANLGKFD